MEAKQPTTKERIVALTYTYNGRRVINSKTIADVFGKNHWDVTKSIRKMVADKICGDTAAIIEDWYSPEHAPHKGDRLPMFILNRHGFEAYRMKRLNPSQKDLRDRILAELDDAPIVEDTNQPKDIKSRHELTTIASALDNRDIAALELTEALMGMPTPKMTINTAEMMKVCVLIKEAHKRIVAIYRDAFILDDNTEYDADMELHHYLDFMLTNFTVKMMRGTMSETNYAAI